VAKRFFYVCAGLCLLVLSFQVGASTAIGQSAGVDAGGVTLGSVNSATIASGGLVWTRSFGAPLGPFPLPRPGHLVAIEGASGGSTNGVPTAQFSILYDNGDWYLGSFPGGWSFFGNVMSGGPTATLPSTWGNVKSTYRR